jgi:subtilisin family serine protease
MKNIFTFFFFVLPFSFVFAQSKVNFDLAKKLKENPSSTVLTDAFVKGNIHSVEQLCESSGGQLRYSSGDISVIRVPLASLKGFIANKNIIRVEAYTPRMQPLNDTMAIQTNVVQVQNGNAPLTQGYDGSGVIVGIIDTGIDFTHPDFKDSAGKSRILNLWDQTLSPGSNTPSLYGYGREWTNVQIDSGLASAHNDLAYAGHGTHVAGIAAGNGLATGNYKGVAPKADIIFVAFDFNGTAATNMIDAVNYIYDKAQALGKPCVINASLGDYYGSHDGRDLQAQMINSILNTQSGRAFVAAAGNAGNYPYHLGYNVTADTNFTFLTYAGQPSYIQLWADTADFKNVDFSIGADQMNPYSFRGRLPFSDMSAHLGVLREDTLYNNGNRIGRILSYGDSMNGTHSLEFLIYPDSTNYKWRLITTGSGKFDAWGFDLYSGILPSASVMSDSIFYKGPDVSKTIVSSYNCIDNVISVANYTNRHHYVDYNGNLAINTATIAGARHITSSLGPTRDDRIKPDIAAPGDNTLAAVVLSLAPGIIANYPDALAQGGYHVRDGGTSHASPCVAGVAALYLQKYPSAYAMQVKDAIINCPKTDVFTGSFLPNNAWGYGKIDAFGALTCSLTGLPENNSPAQAFNIYPNPSGAGTLINIELLNVDNENNKVLQIYNTIGEVVKTIAFNGSGADVSVDLPKGIYFCHLLVNGGSTYSQKLIIL